MAFKPAYCCVLANPSADGKAPDQRVLLGRAENRGNSTLLIDPNKRSVEIVPLALATYKPCLIHNEQCYWGKAVPSAAYPFAYKLYRTGFPRFEQEAVNDVVVPQGTMLMHQGRFYVFEYKTKELHVADGITGKLRRLRGRCPGNPMERSEVLLASSHYGIVVRTSKGIYEVDLKPQKQ